MNTVDVLLMRPIIERLGWTLVHSVWQGVVLAALLAVVLIALRRASAGARYLAACGTFAFMFIAPVLTVIWFPIERPLTAAWMTNEHRSTPTVNSDLLNDGDRLVTEPRDIPPDFIGSAPAVPASELTTPPQALSHRGGDSSPRFVERIDRVLPWLVITWLAGVLVLYVRLLVGWFAVQRIKRRATSPVSEPWVGAVTRLARQLRVSRPVRLLESALVEVPTVIGWLRPVILLPAAAISGLTTDQLEALLCHELAHIRRHDYLVNLLQTVLETLMFYHPAVWWVSRCIRTEREVCCDELAVGLSNNRLGYARALAAMEEIRGTAAQLAVAAGSGSLRLRIRRLLRPSETVNGRSACWVVASILLVAIVTVGTCVHITARASEHYGPAPSAGELDDMSRTGAGAPPSDPIRSAGEANDNSAQSTPSNRGQTDQGWGPVARGLRCRVTPVAPETNDDATDRAVSVEQFSRAEDISFAVELQNVSDAPIRLLGVRYGDSFAPPAPGKFNAEGFGPFLFEFDFTDSSGKPVERPMRVFLEKMLMMSGMSVHSLEPGKSLTVLLRPAKFMAPMEYRLKPGRYRTRVRYHGPSEQVVQEMRKHWPDQPQGSAWSGEVGSGEVSFTIAQAAAPAKPSPLAWGEPKDGLRAAVEFRVQSGQSQRTPVAHQDGVTPRAPAAESQPVAYPHGTKLDVRLHVQNVSDHIIQIVSETWRQDDQVTVTDEAGVTQQLSGSWYSGWPIMVRWTLQPGQTAELSAANIGIAADDEAAKKFEHPTGRLFIAKPGRYSILYSIRLGSIQQQDKDGNVVVPGKQDWQGLLETGPAPLVVRVPQPGDAVLERPHTFTGLVEFRSSDPGAAEIESGAFEVKAPDANYRVVARGEIRSGANEVPDCPDGPLVVSVRAPGYEEALFHDIKLTANQSTRLTLTPAAPTRFRLVSAADGRAIAGATVRYFNRSAAKASAGPYPMDGSNGPVWTTSNAAGMVVLDTLQRTDPHYAKLGDSVYYFYVEPPPELAPLFVGPIKAGQELGDIIVGPFLEARGEIRGTAVELENFAAEWDQPVEMKTDNPQATWLYAVSRPLETKREGDTLTFHLSGLRPGKLRIISNFAPGSKSISHTYSRRDVRKDDVVFEKELTASVHDIVVTAGGIPDATSSPNTAALRGRLFVDAGIRSTQDKTRFFQLAIAIDPNTGAWTRLQNLSDSGGFTVPLSPVRVSPDGRTMLFMRGNECWKCDAGTGDRPERVLEKGSPAAWSPDSKAFFAVVSAKESDYQAVENWLVSADGGDHSVLRLPDADVVEDWSPDGQWLAVSSRKDGQLYLVRPDGGGRRRVTDTDANGSRNEYPRFSPDSQRIVYHRTIYSGEEDARSARYSLRTINTDGTGDHEILGESGVGSTPGTATWTAPMGARWSPDGRHLAVVLFDHTRGDGIAAIGGNWRIAIMDAEGGNPRELMLEGVLNTVLPWDGVEWRPASALRRPRVGGSRD